MNIRQRVGLFVISLSTFAGFWSADARACSLASASNENIGGATLLTRSSEGLVARDGALIFQARTTASASAMLKFLHLKVSFEGIEVPGQLFATTDSPNLYGNTYYVWSPSRGEFDIGKHVIDYNSPNPEQVSIEVTNEPVKVPSGPGLVIKREVEVNAASRIACTSTSTCGSSPHHFGIRKRIVAYDSGLVSVSSGVAGEENVEQIPLEYRRSKTFVLRDAQGVALETLTTTGAAYFTKLGAQVCLIASDTRIDRDAVAITYPEVCAAVGELKVNADDVESYRATLKSVCPNLSESDLDNGLRAEHPGLARAGAGCTVGAQSSSAYSLFPLCIGLLALLRKRSRANPKAAV
jgi:hypothetical protein